MGSIFYSLLAILLLITVPAYAERVISVHDGDTFTIENGDKIRLAGIDAPELKQSHGYEARDYLQKLVKDKDVTLECDGSISYSRKVCSAFVFGLSIQKELVGWGLAYDWPQYSGGQYSRAENFAKKMKRGVWTTSEGELRPWLYRSTKRYGKFQSSTR